MRRGSAAGPRGSALPLSPTSARGRPDSEILDILEVRNLPELKWSVLEASVAVDRVLAPLVFNHALSACSNICSISASTLNIGRDSVRASR